MARINPDKSGPPQVAKRSPPLTATNCSAAVENEQATLHLSLERIAFEAAAK